VKTHACPKCKQDLGLEILFSEILYSYQCITLPEQDERAETGSSFIDSPDHRCMGCGYEWIDSFPYQSVPRRK
jgi:hypothetical protein